MRFVSSARSVQSASKPRQSNSSKMVIGPEAKLTRGEWQMEEIEEKNRRAVASPPVLDCRQRERPRTVQGRRGSVLGEIARTPGGVPRGRRFATVQGVPGHGELLAFEGQRFLAAEEAVAHVLGHGKGGALPA